MLIHQQPEDLLARKGRLDGTRVWRTPVLQDGRVFLRKDEESRAGFTVDLMLDASASRLRCQESIAIEGYILAKSLAACGIPVRVTSFCSLRGYTVLHILKDFGDKNGERRVFDYFAAGWNRDGLALRGMGDVVVPMLITTGGICLFRVVWIFGVVALFPTLTVTLLNYPVSWVLTSVLFLFYYHFRMKKLTAH